MKSKAKTLGQLIRWHAVTSPDDAVFVSRRATPMTFAQLSEQIEGMRVVLNAAGIGRTDRVAMVSDDIATAVGTFFGLLDATSVAPLNAALSDAEFRAAMKRVPFDAVVIQDDLTDVIRFFEAEGHKVIRIENRDGSTGSVRLIGGQSDPCSAPGPVEPDDEGTIQMTTGTTGAPKGAIATQATMAVRALVAGNARGCQPGETGTVFSPPYVAALFNRVASSVALGGTMLLSRRFDPDQLLDDFVDFHINWIGGGPAFLRELVRAGRTNPERARKNSLKFVISSTTKLPTPLMEEVQEVFGVPCLEQYASTETGTMCMSPPPPAPRKPGKVGLPLECKIAIHGDDGQLLGINMLGRVAVKSDALFSGYFEDAETTTNSFHDGYFDTGDMGFLDADGYLELVGRKKELINRGGEKISPFEVEAALNSHPGVQESIAFALPHPTLGEVAAAAVVLKNGATADDTELKLHARSSLTAFKVPGTIVLAGGIPMGSTKKPDRLGAPAYYGLNEEQIKSASPLIAPNQELDGLEIALGALWADCLNLGSIGQAADFIESGGDSLQAMRLVVQVEEVTGVELGVDVIFDEGSTIQGMAALIRARREKNSDTAPAPQTKAPPLGRRSIRFAKRKARQALAGLNLLERKADTPPLSGAPDFDEVLRRIDSLTKNWPGERLPFKFPAFGFHLDGKRAPLVFCFNDAHEPSSLIGYMNRDQPLIAVRSLNKVLSDVSMRPDYIDDLASSFLEELLYSDLAQPYAFAGNCGAGPIAEAMARKWNTRTGNASKLILLEAEPLAAYQGSVHMIFGRESRRFNPFFSRRDPLSEWKELHGDPEFSIIPGDHGQYFIEPSIIDLASSINKALK